MKLSLKIRTLILLIAAIIVFSGCDSLTSQATVTSIEVDATTLEENYDIDTFELSNIKIKVTLSDGKFQLIPLTEAMLSNEFQELLLTAGEHEIIVTYEGKTTSFTLNLDYSGVKAQLLAIYNMAATQGGYGGSYEDWLESIKGPKGDPGVDGKQVNFQVAEGFIQWQYVGDSSWENLVELTSLVGPAGQDGVNGKEVTFRVFEDYIQWQYVDDLNWTNLMSLSTLTGAAGADGKEVMLQVADGFIQWQYVGSSSWKNLVELTSLMGPAGQDGEDGNDGKEVTFRVFEGFIQWQYVGDSTWKSLVELTYLTGPAGKSAYEIYKENNPSYTKTEAEWLEDLVNGALATNEKTKYTVTFDSNGGSNVEEQEVIENQKATTPEDPTRDGYTFEGWFMDEDKWSFIGYPVTENIILVAKWKEIVSFDIAGSLLEDNVYKILVESDVASINFNQIVKCDKTWYLSSDLYGTSINLTKIAALEQGDNTFYIFEEDGNAYLVHEVVVRKTSLVTVTFVTNCDTVLENMLVQEGALIGDIPTITKRGYEFEKWDYDLTTPVTSDITLTASWILISYSITYVLDDGTNSVNNPDEYNIISNTILLDDATKSGFEFLGWYSEATFENKVTQIEQGSINDIILYARFVIESYVVLATPVVVISEDGVASWGNVSNASSYLFIINEGEEQVTNDLQVVLEYGDSIIVKAGGDNEYYLDSDYSEPKTYYSIDHEHTDTDDNGICDDCYSSVIETFDIFAINDLHGKFADSDTNVGVDELTTYFKNAVAENPLTLFLSSGDMWQGSGESNLTRGAIIVEWMNYVGFDSMTLGNHEFDWTSSYIEQNGDLATFPMLAINVYDRNTDNPVDYSYPSVLFTKGNTTIGIIGAIGDCYNSIEGSKVSDVYFKTGSELTALVKAEATRLRDLGADYIIYSIHDGYNQSFDSVYYIDDNEMTWYDPTLSDGYIDLVFEGHTHQGYVLIDSYNVYHLQGRGENNYISNVEVSINFVTGSSVINDASLIPSSVYADSSMYDDPIVEDLLEKYDDQISISNQFLGQNDEFHDSTMLGNLAAEVYCEAGIDKWGETYNIVLGGGSINPRSPGCLYPGSVTYGDIQTLFPFDNDIQLCSLKGIDLLNNFINNDSYYISLSDYGYSIIDYINEDDTYYIITDTWNTSYAPNNLTIVESYEYGIYLRDLVADYIRNGGLTSSPNGIILDTPVVTISEDGVASWTEVPYASSYTYIIDDGEEISTLELSVTLTLGQRVVVKANGDNTIYFDSDYSVSKGYNVKDVIDLTSIPDIYSIGESLEANGETTFEYYVKGEIISINNTKYGNVYIEDEQGNTLYIYGIYDSTGSIMYEDLEIKPQVGDMVILQGKIKNYQGSSPVIEMIYAKLIDDVIDLTSIPDIYSIGESLEANGETTFEYYVKGEIISINNTKYGNVYIEDEQGNSLYIYGIYDSTGSIMYEDLEIKPQVGDMVILQGKIKNYQGSSPVIEMIYANLVDENGLVQNVNLYAIDCNKINELFTYNFA